MLLPGKQPGRQKPARLNNASGKSGTADQLMEKYGLNEQAIVAAVEKVMARRK